MTTKLKFTGSLIAAFFLFTFSSIAMAGFEGFEGGTDGAPILSTIDGLEFTASGPNQWLYGDWTTGNYNGPYPNGAYYSEGDFFAWMGSSQDIGTITFTASTATYFTIGYSSQGGIELKAYDDTGNLLDSDVGLVNLGTGQLDFVRVDATEMAYVTVEGLGNYWMVDDVETDAITQCTENSQCDDDLFCNGAELCLAYECAPGAPPQCPDDALYCNGEEVCDEDVDSCAHANVPVCEDDGLFCTGDELCSEQSRSCESTGDPCPSDEYCDDEIDECVGDEPEEDVGDPTLTGGQCCGC